MATALGQLIPVRSNRVHGLMEQTVNVPVDTNKPQKAKYVAIYRTTYRGDMQGMDTMWFANEQELTRWLQDPYGADLSTIRVIEIKKEIPVNISISLKEEDAK